jgi:hypothetical protein
MCCRRPAKTASKVCSRVDRPSWSAARVNSVACQQRERNMGQLARAGLYTSHAAATRAYQKTIVQSRRWRCNGHMLTVKKTRACWATRPATRQRTDLSACWPGSGCGPSSTAMRMRGHLGVRSSNVFSAICGVFLSNSAGEEARQRGGTVAAAAAAAPAQRRLLRWAPVCFRSRQGYRPHLEPSSLAGCAHEAALAKELRRSQFQWPAAAL